MWCWATAVERTWPIKDIQGQILAYSQGQILAYSQGQIPVYSRGQILALAPR